VIARWYDRPLVGLDLETTGPDPQTAIPVSYAVILDRGTGSISVDSQLVDPGVPIPQEATAVHGITDAMVAGATHVAITAGYLLGMVARLSEQGYPIVAMNGSFDLTIIERLAVEHGYQGLRTIDWQGPLLDLYVLDKQVDRYRKGSRNLGALCEHYGVSLADRGHDARSDAVAAVLCVRAIARKYRQIGMRTPAELHRLQAAWRREQVKSLSDYFVDKGESAIPAHEWSWPFHDLVVTPEQ